MIEVEERGSWYVVMINGQMLGKFGHQFDANRFAIMLLEAGEAASVTLVSGLVLDTF